METERKTHFHPFLYFLLFIILRLLYLSYDSLESLRIVNSEVSEDLAVDLDTSLVECTHKCRIGHVLETSSSVDTLDPQCTEVALLVTAVTVSVCETLLISVLGYGPHILASTKVALGLLQYPCSLSF